MHNVFPRFYVTRLLSMRLSYFLCDSATFYVTQLFILFTSYLHSIIMHNVFSRFYVTFLLSM